MPKKITAPTLDAEAIAYYFDHADEFVRDQILLSHATKFKPTWQQKEALDGISKYNKLGIRSGHGTGKDAVFSWIILWFLRTRPAPTKIPCTAPTYHQLHDVLWAELSRWLQHSNLSHWMSWIATELYWSDDKKGRFAVARSSKKSDNMQGFHAEHLLWVCDEAYGITDPRIPEIIEASCTDTSGDNKIIFGGNPTVISGYYHDAFNSDKKNWNLLTWNAEESPNVAKEQCERTAQKWGKQSDIYRVRILGLPPRGNPDAFLQLTDIEQAIQRDAEESGKIVFGVDCARFGDDLTAIAIRRGFKVYEIRTKEKTDEIDIAQMVIKTVRDYKAKLHYHGNFEIRIDTTGGYGAGAYDILKRNKDDNLQVVPINFASGGNKEYKNATSIMWGDLRDILPDLSLPDDVNLVGELSTRRWSLVASDSREKILIEPKSDYKKEFGQSPDRSDALILCTTQNGLQKKLVQNFNPMDCMRDFEIEFNNLSPNSFPVISLWVNKALKTSATAGLWNSESGKLWVFYEEEFDNPQPEVLIPKVTSKIRQFAGFNLNLNKWEWFGSKEFFSEIYGDMQTAYRKYNIHVRENVRYDEHGSILLLSRLIFRKRLFFLEGNTFTAMQLSEWGLRNDKPDESFTLARSLCNLVSSMVETGRDKAVRPKFEPYSKESQRFHENVDNHAKTGRLHEFKYDDYKNSTDDKDSWMKW